MSLSQPLDTPTLQRLRQQRQAERLRPYVYLLTDEDLRLLSAAGVPMQAVTAYACIKGAVKAARGHEWVVVPQRTRDAVGKDWRWWHEQTQRLERAGFIDCQRCRGRLPRYRLRTVVGPASIDAVATSPLGVSSAVTEDVSDVG